jgi:hypothetical protein
MVDVRDDGDVANRAVHKLLGSLKGESVGAQRRYM